MNEFRDGLPRGLSPDAAAGGPSHNKDFVVGQPEGCLGFPDLVRNVVIEFQKAKRHFNADAEAVKSISRITEDVSEESLIASAKDPTIFPPSGGFWEWHGLSKQAMRDRKIGIGLEMMDRLRWKRDPKGSREPIGDLQRVMGMLNGKQRLSLEDLKWLKHHATIIEAIGERTGHHKREYHFPIELSEELTEAFELVDKIERVVGNPLVRAILERDQTNQEIERDRKKLGRTYLPKGQPAVPAKIK